MYISPQLNKWTDAGKDWGQEEKGMTEDRMAGWHHRLDGREFEWTPGAGDGQGGLACCNSWGHKESDTTERLDWAELNCVPKAILRQHLFVWKIAFLLVVWMTGKEEVCYNVYTSKWFKTVLNWAFKIAPKPCSLVLFLSDLEPQGGKKRDSIFAA